MLPSKNGGLYHKQTAVDWHNPIGCGFFLPYSNAFAVMAAPTENNTTSATLRYSDVP